MLFTVKCRCHNCVRLNPSRPAKVAFVLRSWLYHHTSLRLTADTNDICQFQDCVELNLHSLTILRDLRWTPLSLFLPSPNCCRHSSQPSSKHSSFATRKMKHKDTFILILTNLMH